MPELPEVEVVRRGLERYVVGRRIVAASLSGHRVAREHPGGCAGLAAALRGTTVLAAQRRGKFLWLPLSTGPALAVHLRMSGQLLVSSPQAPVPAHTHARIALNDGAELRFIDQRTFGYLTTAPLVADPYAQLAPPLGIPEGITHIAPDPFEAAWNPTAVARRMRARNVEIKRQLLDQTIVSGIGNIYADEALWRSGIHGRRRGPQLRLREVTALLSDAKQVMAEALDAGGTSFDALYVDVNGASGSFARSLHAYGRQGLPCERCATAIVKETIGGRGSYVCPRCQRPPRVRHR